MEQFAVKQINILYGLMKFANNLLILCVFALKGLNCLAILGFLNGPVFRCRCFFFIPIFIFFFFVLKTTLTGAINIVWILYVTKTTCYICFGQFKCLSNFAK